MEIVVAEHGVQLVVDGIFGTCAIIYASVGYVDICEILKC